MFVEITIKKSKYKIPCKDSQRTFTYPTQKLNELTLSKQLKDADNKLLIIMSALLLEEELSQAQKIKSPIIARWTHQAISKNIEDITNQIKQITDKIENY